MSRRTRTRDEQDNNTIPPPPSDNDGKEKKEEREPEGPPQRRPRTEPPLPENPEVPPGTQNTGGGGLSAALSRAGVPDSSRPGHREPTIVDSQIVRGVAIATFKPRWCGDRFSINVARQKS